MRFAYMLVVGLVITLSSAACVQSSEDGRGTATSRADLPADLALDTVDVFTPGSDVVERFKPESDKPQLIPLADVDPTEPGTQAVSCSSRDGKKDCFCGSDGCWRTETSCGCTAIEQDEIEP